MPRFEEVQALVAESARKYLDIYDMQVFIEQFTLDREGKFFLTLYNMEEPYPVSASVSFIYDAFQTGMSFYEDPFFEEKETDVDLSIDLEIVIKLPIMQNYPNIESLFDEIIEEFPDTEPIFVAKEVVGGEDSFKEYEMHYSYSVEPTEVLDIDFFEGIFEELREIMELIYKKTEDYIDFSWYGDKE